MEKKKLKLKKWIIPKKETHKYEYLLKKYIYEDFCIDDLEINKYRSDYTNLILNNSFLIKELTDEAYKKLVLLNTLLWNSTNLLTKSELNNLVKKINNPPKRKIINNHNKKITYYVWWKKITERIKSPPHIVYNKNW